MPPSAWSTNASFRRRNNPSYQSQPYLQGTSGQQQQQQQRLKKFNVGNGPISSSTLTNNSNSSTNSQRNDENSASSAAFNGGVYHSTFKDIDKLSDESSTQTNITNELTINESTSGSSTDESSSSNEGGGESRKVLIIAAQAANRNNRHSADSSDNVKPSGSEQPMTMLQSHMRLKNNYDNVGGGGEEVNGQQSAGGEECLVLDEEKVEVVVSRDVKQKDFGFTIADSLYGQGVYVSKIRPGSLAEQNLYLKTNTKIFKVCFFF
jgi:hypothetical protein